MPLRTWLYSIEATKTSLTSTSSGPGPAHQIQDANLSKKSARREDYPSARGLRLRRRRAPCSASSCPPELLQPNTPNPSSLLKGAAAMANGTAEQKKIHRTYQNVKNFSQMESSGQSTS